MNEQNHDLYFCVFDIVNHYYPVNLLWLRFLTSFEMTVSNLGYRVGLVGGKAANQPHSTHELTKSLSFRAKRRI